MFNDKCSMLNHPILQESFAIIDSEVKEHHFNPQEYAIARRVIHATADFDYLDLLQFSPNAIASGMAALRQGLPIITDVSMVKEGIRTLVGKTSNNPIINAIEQAEIAAPGKTRTETGLLRCWEKYPQGIYVIGNAPTALSALCQQLTDSDIQPALVIGVPVGFVAVIESKQALAQANVPHILTLGRKGGSPVAASILNALLILTTNN
jgi:precorrin-8X/cobalt-precorrin-8 methylmutase